MSKKLVAKVLTTTALLSTLAAPASATSFIMEVDGSYARDAILNLAERGIITGDANGNFNPTSQIQRQDFAIILAKAMGLDVTSAPGTATFNDVPASHYSFAAVEAAAKAGLIHGYGNSQFGNGDSLSRQDMAVLFCRALGIDASGKGASLTFTDSNSISGYARDAVAAAVELGLIKGNPDGTFNPLQSADRQSAALVANKFIQQLEERRNSQPSPATPSDEVTPPSTPTPPTTPETNTPAPVISSTGSGSSSGGSGSGNSGNESERDTIAPSVSIISETPVYIGSNLMAASSETGFLYLVPEIYEPVNQADLEGLVAEQIARKERIAAANTETPIGTAELEAGLYRVFAVDPAGNLSRPSSVIELKHPLSLTMASAFVLNSSRVNYDPILIFTDSSKISSPDPYYFRNASSLLQVQRGDHVLELAYNDQTHHFEILEDSETVIGYLEITSESELIDVEGAEGGLQVSLKEGANEGIAASLKLTLYENDAVVDSSLLTVIMDTTAPAVTDSVYSAGTITIIADEPLVGYADFHIDIKYQSADESSSEDFVLGEHFTLSLEDGILLITLKDEAVASLQLQPGDKFLITLERIGDYAYNMISEEEIPVIIQ